MGQLVDLVRIPLAASHLLLAATERGRECLREVRGQVVHKPFAQIGEGDRAVLVELLQRKERGGLMRTLAVIGGGLIPGATPERRPRSADVMPSAELRRAANLGRGR